MPIAQTAIPTHSSAPRPLVVALRDERERQREEDDEERLRLEEDEEVPVRVRRPAAAQLLVAAVLLLAEDAVEEEVCAEPEAPERGERGGEDTVARVAVREERVEDRAARDEHRPGDVDVTRVANAHLNCPHEGHRRRREKRADEEEPPDRADHVSSSHRR